MWLLFFTVKTEGHNFIGVILADLWVNRTDFVPFALSRQIRSLHQLYSFVDALNNESELDTLRLEIRDVNFRTSLCREEKECVVRICTIRINIEQNSLCMLHCIKSLVTRHFIGTLPCQARGEENKYYGLLVKWRSLSPFQLFVVITSSRMPGSHPQETTTHCSKGVWEQVRQSCHHKSSATLQTSYCFFL